MADADFSERKGTEGWMPAPQKARDLSRDIVRDVLGGGGTRITHTIGTHIHQYYGVAVGGDRRMITANRDRTARLWDIASGQCLMEFRGHADEVRCAVFTADGKHAVTAGNDGTLRMWECATGACVLVMDGHEGEVYAVAVTPDGGHIVSGGQDRSVRVWSVSSGRCTHVVKPGVSSVYEVLITRDGAALVVLDSAGNVYRSAMPDPVEFALISNGNALDRFRDIALTGSGKVVCAALNDGLVSIDILTGEKEKVMPLDPYQPYKVLVTPDDRQLIACCYPKASILAIDRSTGIVKREFNGHKDDVTGMALTSDGGTLCTVSLDWTCRVWDVKQGKPLRRIGQALNVHSLSISGSGSRLAALDVRGNAKTWDIVNGSHRALSGNVSSVIFSGSLDIIVTGHKDGAIRLWDAKREDGPLSVIEGHGYGVMCLAPGADGARFASGSRDGTVKLWDITRGECVRTYKIAGMISRLAFDDRRTRLVAESDVLSDRVYLYDHLSGDRVTALDIPGPRPQKKDRLAGISGLGFLPAGKGILACGYDGYIAVWDPFSFKLLQFLEEPEGSIVSMEAEKDGRHVFVGTRSGQVKRWDLENGQCEVVYTDQVRSILSITLSPDGNSLFIAFNDGTIEMVDRKGPAMQWAILNINEGFFWFTLPDAYSPDGWVFTNREDLLNILEQGRDGRVLGAVPLDDARRGVYLSTRNNPVMVKARLKGTGEYARIARNYSRAIAKKDNEKTARSTAALPKGGPNV